mgnify:CR=1 FL=1
MRLRNIRGSKDVIASCPFVVQEPESCRGRWAEVLEMKIRFILRLNGKRRFLMDMAVLHPEINYVGIEMYDSVLLRAVQKREKTGDGNQKPVLYPHGCAPASGSIRRRRSGPHLP